MEPSVAQHKVGRRAVVAGMSSFAAIRKFGWTRAQGPATVKFAFFGTPDEQASYQRLVDEFNVGYPEIEIVPVAKPTGDPSIAVRGVSPVSPYQPWLSTALGTTDEPDVFLLNYRQFGEYAARGAIEPIGPYLNGSTLINADDFYPSSLDAFRFPGFAGDGLGAIPQNASSLVVYHNLDVFSQLNVRIPPSDWSWDEFALIAKSLTVDLNGDGHPDIYGLAIEPTISRYAAFVWGAGGEIVDNVDLPTKLDVDSADAQAGLAWFTSLGQAGLKVVPTETEARTVNDLTRFLSGGAAMFVHSRRVVPTLRQQAKFAWDVAPLPVGKVAANVLHSDAFCMASAAGNKDAAWTFIEFANGPQGQQILAETGRTVPSLRSVAQSDAFLKGSSFANTLGISLPPKGAQVFLDNAEIARRLPSVTSWPSVETSFNQAFKKAFYVDADVAAATQTVNAQSRGIFGDSLNLPINAFREPGSEAEE